MSKVLMTRVNISPYYPCYFFNSIFFLIQAKIDLKRNAEVNAMVEAQGKTKETVAALGAFPSNMIVVKLNSGGVLLYNPNRIREGIYEHIFVSQNKKENGKSSSGLDI